MTTEALVSKLDRFVTIRLDEVSNTGLRRASGYGISGREKTRKQPWGWEYRAPLSWLSSPRLVKGVFSTAWVLGQAQRHGTLHRLEEWDDLFSFPRDMHAKNVKGLLAYLDDLRRSKRRLEEMEVFAEWGLRDLRAPTLGRWKVKFNLQDDFMPQIAELLGELHSCKKLMVVGARKERTRLPAVFLPKTMKTEPPASERVSYLRWDVSNIGLSWALRQNVALAAQTVTVREILRCLDKLNHRA